MIDRILKTELAKLIGPAAIAFSGGGDSTALVHALAGDARITHVLIIDHALRDTSAAEAEQAASFARNLGYETSVIRWDHDHPTTGIQVKAREYRYAAMGEVCRAQGITHLLTAHTRDDQAETLLMRKARASHWRGMAGMAKRAYGPLWPALAGVTLWRPLLKASRADLRNYNAQHDLNWIEDPSNENQDFARIRARTDLSANTALTDDLLEVQQRNRDRLDNEAQALGVWLSRYAEISPHGFVTTTRVPPEELLLHLLRAVSGTGGPIDAARRASLAHDMADSDFKAATLAGAWVIAKKKGFLFTRDMVAVAGRQGRAGAVTTPVTLRPEYAEMWDGRFRVEAKSAGWRLMPAQGYIENLSQGTETKWIYDLPAEIRPTLPMMQHEDGRRVLGAASQGDVTLMALAPRRLLARFSELCEN